MPSRILLIALVILAAAVAAGQEIPLSAGLQFPHIPYAAVTGPEGVILNPSSLFLNKPLGVQIYHSFPKDKFSGNDGLIVSAAGLGFGYQRLGWTGLSPDKISRYDFAVSSRVVRNIYTGLSYTYYKSSFKPIDKSHSWNFSILAHLAPSLSISAEAQNVNKHVYLGRQTDIGYGTSIALRPIGDRFTIGGNLSMYRGQSLKSAVWQASARAEVARGLVLYTGIDDRHTFGVGLEFRIGDAMVGTEGFFDNNTNHLGTTIYSGYNYAQRDYLIAGPGKILQVDLSGDISEERSSALFLKSPETVYDKLAAIKKAQNDREIKGLLLTIKNPGIGWGKFADFRRAVKDFEKAGKPVICYLGVSPNNGSYYLASAANQVYMLPVDALNLTGLRAEVTFYKGTLDKIGVEAEVEKQGKYKNYPDQFTDTAMTAPHREALESLLDDIYSQILSDIAPDRRLTPKGLSKIIDQGPFTSVQAESLGLVDGRFYPEDFESHLPSMFGGNYFAVSSQEYQANAPYRDRFTEPPEIALISVSGSITTGSSGSNFVTGNTAGSATITRAIRSAKNDRAVKAIVMRLDTPGGDALASDLIWGELQSARRRKPVIVSMSDECASGGYYIAVASDKIFVEPTSVTGSIGVFWGKPNLEQLYRKLGMNTVTIRRGDHADIYSMKQGFTPDERLLVRRQVNDMYRNFVSIVAENRKLSTDSVHTIAQGRVWSGKSALAIGLGDANGGLMEAIDAARVAGDITDRDYRVVEMPERRLSLFNIPDLLMSAIGRRLGLSDSVPAEALRALVSTTGSESMQMQLPYQLTVE